MGDPPLWAYKVTLEDGYGHTGQLGTHASIEDMAKSENISPSFVSRILRLAYLSPTVIEAILDGKYPAQLTMKDLMEPFPMEWDAQARHFGIESNHVA